MEPVIRPLTPADADAVVDLDRYGFAVPPEEDPRSRSLLGFPWERAHGAFDPADPGRLIGQYAVFDVSVAVPDALGRADRRTDATRGGLRAMSCPGLTWVSVHPDHRRRGVLTAMLEHHLADCRDRGEAWSALHASEPGIYGRFGYDVASLDVRYTIGRGTSLQVPAGLRREAEGVRITTVLTTPADESLSDRLAAVDGRCATAWPGTVTVPGTQLHRHLSDVPAERVGREPWRVLIADRDGVDVGYAVYARRLTWSDQLADGVATVSRLQADSPATLMALATRLLDLDLTVKVEFGGRSTDDPLLWWAGGPRANGAVVRDALWLRPVDVAAALTSRGYSAAADLVLDVADERCPWNAGRLRLRVDEDGDATCDPTDRAPDLSVDAGCLGGLFLGTRGIAGAAAQGRVREHTAGALRRAAAAFATGASPLGSVDF